MLERFGKTKIVLPFLFVIAFAVAGLFLLFQANKPQSPKKLAPVEVREYEGKNLSSVEDFRENSIKGPQYVDRKDYKLKISGLSSGEKFLAYDEILEKNQSYKKVVTLDCVEGWSVSILWEGILAKDLIAKNEIPGDANTVILRAADGYSTSFPVDYIMDKDILLAYKMNGTELPPERGFPFQLVAEEKWGYKWIKWITEIELSRDSEYRGYWESRGYSNDGDLDKNFLESK